MNIFLFLSREGKPKFMFLRVETLCDEAPKFFLIVIKCNLKENILFKGFSLQGVKEGKQKVRRRDGNGSRGPQLLGSNA